MSFFATSPAEAAELATAFELATGSPRTAAQLVGEAARDDVLGMPDSAAVFRALADVRRDAVSGRPSSVRRVPGVH